MDSKPYYPEKEFMDTFKQLTVRSRPWEVWKDFITMFACSLSNPLDKTNFNEREVSYMQIICNKKYSPKELELFPKLAGYGVAAYIKIGNSLTEPMSHSDTLENYWFTPMYFSDV